MVFQESFKQKSYKTLPLKSYPRSTIFGAKIFQKLHGVAWGISNNSPSLPLAPCHSKTPRLPNFLFFCSTLGRNFSELWEIFPHPVFWCQGETYSGSFFEERPSLRWFMRNTQDGPRRGGNAWACFACSTHPNVSTKPMRISWSSTCGNQVLEPSPKNRSRNDRIPSSPIHFQVLCHVRSVGSFFCLHFM